MKQCLMTRVVWLLLGVLAVSVLGRTEGEEGDKKIAPAAAKTAAFGPDTNHITQEADAVPCDAHGIAKDVCVRCNPALAASFKEKGDWCATHDVPESQCTICNQALRELITSRNGRKAAALPRSQRPPSLTCTKDKTKVRLASAALAERAGLSYEAVARRPFSASITCIAEVAYDGNHFVQLSSRVPGVVGEVRADLGAKVRHGDVLAVIDSPELAAAKAELHRATASVDLYAKTLARHANLESIGVTAKRTLEEAENKLAEAKIEEARAVQRLRALGLSDEEVRGVHENSDTSALLHLTTPLDGEIVERNAVIGESVGALRMLFAVADTSLMWALLDLTDPRVQLRAAMPVVLQIEGLDGESFAGRITWVSTKLDPKTRTLKARAEFDNADGLLKANMFGRAAVQLRENEDALVVPKEAVQWDGCCNIVFIKENETTFQPRKVHLGLAKDNFFEVRDGLREGEVVVVDGSFLLKTEILKGEIGAGCCPDDIKKKNQ